MPVHCDSFSLCYPMKFFEHMQNHHHTDQHVGARAFTKEHGYRRPQKNTNNKTTQLHNHTAAQTHKHTCTTNT